MNKRPSLQFYPADWLKDPDLQMCSMNTIGIWINLMCRMWEAKEEGVMSGKPGELALLVGARPSEFSRFLKECATHLFADVTNCDGVVTIKCRRMNRLFLEREGAKRRMQRHRQKPCNGDVTPPSSTSSSTSLKYTQAECIDIGISIGISKQQSKDFHTHYSGQGWLFGNSLPITDLRAAMVRWRNNQYKFKDVKNGQRQHTDDRTDNEKPFVR